MLHSRRVFAQVWGRKEESRRKEGIIRLPGAHWGSGLAHRGGGGAGAGCARAAAVVAAALRCAAVLSSALAKLERVKNASAIRQAVLAV
jgi:hypothetical protein